MDGGGGGVDPVADHLGRLQRRAAGERRRPRHGPRGGGAGEEDGGGVQARRGSWFALFSIVLFASFWARVFLTVRALLCTEVIAHSLFIFIFSSLLRLRRERRDYIVKRMQSWPGVSLITPEARRSARTHTDAQMHSRDHRQEQPHTRCITPGNPRPYPRLSSSVSVQGAFYVMPEMSAFTGCDAPGFGPIAAGDTDALCMYILEKGMARRQPAPP